MNYKSLILVLFVFGILSTSLPGRGLDKRAGEVKYISKQSYYINLGAEEGLSVGDTVLVIRNRVLIGKLVVQRVAKRSSACKLLIQKNTIHQGDKVEILVQHLNDDSKLELSKKQKIHPPETNLKSTINQRRISKRIKKRKSNKVRGRFGIQSIWFDDMGNSDLDYNQLAFRSKLEVKKILGIPLSFRFRWRSKTFNRQKTLSDDIANDEWNTQVYELGLVYENGNSPFEFSLGRILSHRIRGIGYIDGALFSVKMHGRWRFGLVGGTQPSLRGSSFQTSEQKFGVFLNFEQGEYRTQKISTTLAFTGRYYSGTVSREFIYVQNNLWKGSKFSIYQTVELDLNRGWKNDLGYNFLQLSNFFFNSRFSPVNFFTLTLSYDARKNIRVFETRSIPDSLFDETTRQGLHTGITLRLPYRIRLSGNLGIRLRKGNLNNTLSASGALRVRNIFNTWATFNARFSYFSTMFTKGYRPNINLRIPILREFSLNLGGGSYIYQTITRTTRSNWLETDGYYRINRWLFANFGYRYFFDERLNSGRLFVETGVVF